MSTEITKTLVTTGRKLCTVRKIDNLEAIENADAIELAIIDGWQVVVKKGEFKVGEFCMYFEIDSFLPASDARFAFLLKSGVKTDEVGTERIRLKTIKLRGQISQGLALPVDLFSAEISTIKEIDKDFWHQNYEVLVEELQESRDGVEQFLKVTKYEKPEERNGNAGGNAKTAGDFPVCIPKTDEDRLQNVYGKFSTNLQDVYFRPSLKLDGSSITVAYISDEKYFCTKLDDEKVQFNEVTQELDREPISYPFDYGTSQGIVCSRNLVLKHAPESNFWKGVNNTDIMPRLKEYCETYDRQLALQGELMGPGVQGNREKLEEHGIYAFRIWDITNQEFLDDKDFLEVCEYLKIKITPLFDVIQPFKKYSTLKEFLEASDITSISHKVAEGIVYKSVDKVLYRGQMQTVHFKVINNKFLLKCDD